MTRILRRSSWLVLPAMVLGLVTSSQCQESGVQVTYSLNYSDISSVEPVTLTVVVKNQTKQALRIDLGEGRTEFFYFTVSGPLGAKSLSPPPPRGIVQFGLITLAPGASERQSVILSNWGSFESPGVYTITLRLKGTLGLDTDHVVSVQSEPVLLTVEPFANSSSLSKLHCQQELSLLENSLSYQPALQAALYLSNVRSPVAVPYISAALRSDFKIGGVLISGLERIGDVTAVNALALAQSSGSTENAELARGALVYLRDNTSDAQVANAAREALDKLPQATHH